ncbi:MAG: rod shape-determining protein MreD [Clostridium sp.]
MTFSFGFIYGKKAGLLYGLFAGILLDLFYSGPFGFYTLLFINIGYFNGICTQYYYEDYINLPLVMSLVNELIQTCVYLCVPFSDPEPAGFPLLRKEIIIPELIFTVVTTLLIYRFFLSANRRLDEMDNRREREY